jgi:superfamily I DNA/RNA helicase
MKEEAIFGSAGCGKTTEIVRVINEYKGSVTACSFTKAAAGEISRRVTKKNLLASTLHSMAYKHLGLNPGQVVQDGDLKRVTALAGVNIDSANCYNAAYALAGASGLSYEEAFNKMGSFEYPVEGYLKFCAVYDDYKERFGVLDFNDMLKVAIRHRNRISAGLLIVDEAQDMSPLQWEFVDNIKADRKVFAGDDWQTIFEFAGAEPDRLLSIENYRVLGTTYRLFQEMVDYSATITDRITKQRRKHIVAHKGKGGIINRFNVGRLKLDDRETLILYRSKSELPLLVGEILRTTVPVKGSDLIGSNGWECIGLYNNIAANAAKGINIVLNRKELALASKYFKPNILRDIHSGCRRVKWWDGMILAEIEARYFKAVIDKYGYDYVPNATLSTIHSSKGLEADRVVLYTGVSDLVSFNSDTSLDSELRVWYVGVTRAKNQLDLLDSENLSFI